MKPSIITILFLSFVLTSAKCDTLVDFYHVLNSNLNKGPEAAYHVLAASGKINDWSLGGGLGPVDQEYLRFLAVTSLYQEIKKIPQTENLEEWEAKVVDAAKSFPNDSKRIASLLDSNDPSIRWIALQKCKELESDQMRQHAERLKAIVLKDSLIFISKKAIPSLDGLPTSPGLAIHTFTAPNRELAASLLKIPFDDTFKRTLSEAGSDRLLEIATTHSERKADVVYAIELLDPSFPGIKELQNVFKRLATD